jgi:hypothetical protein
MAKARTWVRKQKGELSGKLHVVRQYDRVVVSLLNPVTSEPLVEIVFADSEWTEAALKPIQKPKEDDGGPL